jgi:hypothetical protein
MACNHFVETLVVLTACGAGAADGIQSLCGDDFRAHRPRVARGAAERTARPRRVGRRPDGQILVAAGPRAKRRPLVDLQVGRIDRHADTKWIEGVRELMAFVIAFVGELIALGGGGA